MRFYNSDKLIIMEFYQNKKYDENHNKYYLYFNYNISKQYNIKEDKNTVYYV